MAYSGCRNGLPNLTRQTMGAKLNDPANFGASPDDRESLSRTAFTLAKYLLRLASGKEKDPLPPFKGTTTPNSLPLAVGGRRLLSLEMEPKQFGAEAGKLIQENLRDWLRNHCKEIVCKSYNRHAQMIRGQLA